MEAINQIKDKAEDIFDEITTYAEARWNLGVLNASSKAADGVSAIATALVMGAIGVIVLVFLSIAAALFIGASLNNLALGFLAVGIFYAIVGVIVYIIKDKYIKIPVINTFIKKFYYED
jgi:hypothetical protein